jgi:hypothetical protein
LIHLKKSNADCGQSMAVIVKMKIKKREKMYEKNNDNRKLMNNGNDVMKIEWNVFFSTVEPCVYIFRAPQCTIVGNSCVTVWVL